MRRLAVFFALFSSCSMWDASNPYKLTPCDQSSTWSPMKGNTLVSSKYCKTLLPETFGKEALSLAELLDIALSNNPSTQQTWAAARSAAGAYGQSLSSYYPNIQFSGTYTRERASFLTGGPLSMYLQTTAGPELLVTYTLLDFDLRSSAADTAREALYNADWTHNQQIQIVLQTIMNDYYNYQYQLSTLHSFKENLENAEASLDAANQRFALGLAALGDVAQSRTQYLQSKINLTSQQQAVENSFAQLAVDLGLPANVAFKVQEMPDQIATDPILDSVAVLVERAQRQRQDLLAAEANVRSKEAAVRNARAQEYPIVNGSFDIGKNWYNAGLQDPKPYFTAGVSLTFPLFAGFYYRNGIRAAQANLEQAKAQMLQTELGIVQAVATSHMNVKTSALNMRYTEEYLQSAQIEFDIALQSYKAGTATILDVLSAQSSLADARTKKAEAQYTWFSSLAQIAYATGSLCMPSGEESCP